MGVTDRQRRIQAELDERTMWPHMHRHLEFGAPAVPSPPGGADREGAGSSLPHGADGPAPSATGPKVKTGGYPGLPESADLRRRERAAWEVYRDLLDAGSDSVMRDVVPTPGTSTDVCHNAGPQEGG